MRREQQTGLEEQQQQQQQQPEPVTQEEDHHEPLETQPEVNMENSESNEVKTEPSNNSQLKSELKVLFEKHFDSTKEADLKERKYLTRLSHKVDDEHLSTINSIITEAIEDKES